MERERRNIIAADEIFETGVCVESTNVRVVLNSCMCVCVCAFYMLYSEKKISGNWKNISYVVSFSETKM